MTTSLSSGKEFGLRMSALVKDYVARAIAEANAKRLADEQVLIELLASATDRIAALEQQLAALKARD